MTQANTATETIQASATRITAGYVRLTREESIQNGLSIPAQKDGITSYAQRNELPKLTFYVEQRAVGADVAFEKRQAGRQLIADIRSGRVGNVICRDVDRLSRDTILWLKLVELCCQNGVTIHTFSGPLPMRSPSDRFTSTVRAAAAQLEKDQVADRVRLAKRELAKQGKPLGGPPPFGYTSRSRRIAELVASGVPRDQARSQAETQIPMGLTIDQKEAEVVRLIFDLYVERLKGSRAIANELNRLGYRRRSGRLWHPDKIRRVINDPVLAGKIPYDEGYFLAGYGKRAPKHRQTLHEGRHEAIISLQQWRRAQEIRQRNQPTIRRPAVGRKAPLAGVLRCRCGAAMTSRGAGKGKSYFYYICTKRKAYGRAAPGGCDGGRVNSDRLHEVFWAQLSRAISSEEVVDQVLAAVKQVATQDKGPNRSQAKVDLAKVQRDLELWYTRHDEAAGDAEKEAAWRRIVQLTEKLRQLEEAVKRDTARAPKAKTPSRRKVKEHLGAIQKLLSQAQRSGRALVRSLADHHGLTARMLDDQTVKIEMRLHPPGPEGEPIELRTQATIPSASKVDRWLERETVKKRMCACGCGRPIELVRRHYWTGIPTYRSDCRHRAMQAKRASVTGEEYINGTQLARKLGVGRTTIGRWIRQGKLPEPKRGISGMLLFPKEVIQDLQER